MHLTGGGDGTIRDIVQTQWTSSPSSSSRLGTVCVHWVPRARAHTNLPAHTRYSRKHPIVPSVRTRARAPHPDPASSSTSASSRLVRVCVHCTRERARAPTSPPRTHTAFEETPECTPARARAHAPAPPRQRSEPKQRMDTCAAIAIKKRAENGRQNATHFFLCFFLQSFFLSSLSPFVPLLSATKFICSPNSPKANLVSGDVSEEERDSARVRARMRARCVHTQAIYGTRSRSHKVGVMEGWSHDPYIKVALTHSLELTIILRNSDRSSILLFISCNEALEKVFVYSMMPSSLIFWNTTCSFPSCSCSSQFFTTRQ